jgi:hypothetical protein
MDDLEKRSPFKASLARPASLTPSPHNTPTTS